jgi:hypothetical protein
MNEAMTIQSTSVIKIPSTRIRIVLTKIRQKYFDTYDGPPEDLVNQFPVEDHLWFLECVHEYELLVDVDCVYDPKYDQSVFLIARSTWVNLVDLSDCITINIQ